MAWVAILQRPDGYQIADTNTSSSKEQSTCHQRAMHAAMVNPLVQKHNLILRKTTKHTLTKLGPEDENDEEHENTDDGSGDDLLLVHPSPVSTAALDRLDSLADHFLQSPRSSVDGAVCLQQVIARVLELLPLATQRVEYPSAHILGFQRHTLSILQSPGRVCERLRSSEEASTRREGGVIILVRVVSAVSSTR